MRSPDINPLEANSMELWLVFMKPPHNLPMFQTLRYFTFPERRRLVNISDTEVAFRLPFPNGKHPLSGLLFGPQSVKERRGLKLKLFDTAGVITIIDAGYSDFDTYIFEQSARARLLRMDNSPQVAYAGMFYERYEINEINYFGRLNLNMQNTVADRILHEVFGNREI